MPRGFSTYDSARLQGHIPLLGQTLEYYPAENDPFREYVQLLLHADGLNGNRVILDSSPLPKLPRAFGNARVSNAQSRFSGSSLFFDGASDYFQINYTPVLWFGASDWTWECWHYPVSFATTQGFLWDFGYGNPNNLRSIAIAINQMTGEVLIAQSTDGSANFTQSTGITLTVNQWHHLAFSRSGANIRCYLNGAHTATITAYNLFNSTTRQFFIGIQGDLQTITSLHGYIDELRVTKGVARYPGNFAVPTAPYPDF